MGKRQAATKKKGARAPRPQAREPVVPQSGVTDTKGRQANRFDDYQLPQAHATESQTTKFPREPRPVIVDGSSANFQALMNQGFRINWHVALASYPGPMSYNTPMGGRTATMGNMAMGYGAPMRNYPVVKYGISTVIDAPSVYGFETPSGASSNAGFTTLSGHNLISSAQICPRLPVTGVPVAYNIPVVSTASPIPALPTKTQSIETVLSDGEDA